MEIDVRDLPYYIRVERVEALEGRKIFVAFADGNQGTYDMSPLLDMGVFRALRDEGLFRNVHVSLGVVTWNDEIDISSERLWTDCEPVGEDWRPKLLPKKYFVEYDGKGDAAEGAPEAPVPANPAPSCAPKTGHP